MGSDKARVSYDPTRQYRAVVMQQGRVTLEADWNEAQAIFSEQLRQETLDVLGRAGTPNNGYRVMAASGDAKPFDFTVDKGTMYVGGERAWLPKPVEYSQQSDWLDHAGDPDWVDLTTLANKPPPQEFIYLYLREQEVSAVEDTALREVALGGPDTAQRTRLIQHIVRVATEASQCPTGEQAAAKKWASEGLTHDPDTMRLLSSTTLQVSFPPTSAVPDPCEPEATGGYLGADNQLIRVQITGANTLVWGFDDASFLYRVSVNSLSVLKLQSQPLDVLHQPRTGQAVEVLRSAASLSGTDYISSITGALFTLTKAYDSDQQTVNLPTPLDAIYQNGKETPMVFLRVWEQEVQFTPGAAVSLGQTGMQVTFLSGTGIFHIGDSWRIAVRPNTPTQVYPQRYLDRPQAPDGPRLWACPLVQLGWHSGLLTTLRDYRSQLEPLADALQVPQVLAKDAYGNDIVLRNGMELPAESLAQGLRLILNQNVDPASVTDVGCFVSLDLPFPSSDSDRRIWGNALIAYQRVVLAADVHTTCPDELIWTPFEDTRAFLLGDRLRNKTLRKVQSNFQHDWDVFDPPGSVSSRWDYVDAGVAQTAAAGTGASDQAGLGSTAISKQRVGQNASFMSLTASGTLQGSGDFGLIFDFDGSNEYVAFVCRSFGVAVGFSGGFSAFGLTVIHVTGGVAEILVDQVFDGMSASGVPIIADLDVQRSSDGLLFSAAVSPIFRGQRIQFPVNASKLPGGVFAKGSGVGMLTRFGGNQVTFTRLQVVDGDSGVTTLVPVGSDRALAGLTLKRNFVRPQGSVSPGRTPQNVSLQPQPDFEQWFLLVPPQLGYAYGSFAGLGPGVELV